MCGRGQGQARRIATTSTTSTTTKPAAGAAQKDKPRKSRFAALSDLLGGGED